tara:strand:+ start:131 stop:598 length:468 start_codon:yes stop_codon:yes gene_type:complete
MGENVWVTPNDDDENIFKKYHWKPEKKLKVKRYFKRYDIKEEFNDISYVRNPQEVEYLYWDKQLARWELKMLNLPNSSGIDPDGISTFKWQLLINDVTITEMTEDKIKIKVKIITKRGSYKYYRTDFIIYEDIVFVQDRGLISNMVQWIKNSMGD